MRSWPGRSSTSANAPHTHASSSSGRARRRPSSARAQTGGQPSVSWLNPRSIHLLFTWRFGVWTGIYLSMRRVFLSRKITPQRLGGQPVEPARQVRTDGSSCGGGGGTTVAPACALQSARRWQQQ
jgi:hypothetical protein